ncbi:MAG: NAD(+)/NADH kinase [Deltaproteobacteria bacterium]|nr:NAD(+)/NADH kinase [Deltaproteobacteria bacterium]
MSRLHHVAIVLRREGENLPTAVLENAFRQAGARVTVAEEEKEQNLEDVDLVVALGGDGTVLRALDTFPGRPVLAVNFGTVGFLTAGGRGELDHMLSRLLTGDYLTSERLVLRCRLDGQEHHAVNEAAIKTSSRMIQVDVAVDGTPIRTIRGDGVIVGTPTGSTGYLLSSGSPVVMPDVHCFILDGLNEYNFSSRPLILSPDSQLLLKLHPLHPGQQAALLVDGKVVKELEEGDEIVLDRSPRVARLIFFEPNYFFHNLSSRLAWK